MARANEAEPLTALCIRSKAHWGYDCEFMRQASAGLAVTPAMIDEGRVLVAEDGNGCLLGVTAIGATPTRDEFDLHLLFVEPLAIRAGIGRKLFEAAVRLAEQQGGRRLSILADPFAAPFYRRLGAIRIGEAPSDSIPGRYLPLFEFLIEPNAHAACQ